MEEYNKQLPTYFKYNRESCVTPMMLLCIKSLYFVEGFRKMFTIALKNTEAKTQCIEKINKL